MKKVSFYIGADNETGKVGLVDIVQMMDKHYDGYTIIETRGMWKGNGEHSVIIEVLVGDVESVKEKAKQIASDLKHILNQESIIVTVQTLSDVEFV